MLSNLLGNAIDAMRTGGRLVVRTSRSRLRNGCLPGVRITIADTGYGIPPNTMRRIFEPFFTTKGTNGTGLGLWISERHCEQASGPGCRSGPGAERAIAEPW